MSVTDFTPEQSSTLEWANVALSVVSIMGSGFIVFCYFYLKDLRTFAFRLVLMVSISDIFYSIGNFFGDAGGGDTHLGASDGFCQFQAIVISFFGLSSIFWAISIAFTLHKAFLQEAESFAPNRIHEHSTKYHVICWVVPLVLTLLPLFTDSYGDTGGWCWIKGNQSKHVAWRFFQLYIWLWLGVGYNIYVFLNIHKKIRVIAGNMQGSGAKMANRLKLYPVVLIVCHLFGTINAIYEAVHGGKMVYELNLLAVIFGTSMGLFNALVYGLTPEVAAQLCNREQYASNEQLNDAI
eukprot:CAMPEP_0175143112 /NCGR_PEP_ID=MMETSP0087-20121206/13232_1 /TAXON_ID=136419 /ORGANISM="Unknown Unknown, Strain D1" /LENGTH=293 /DNA_ID=CAMNT_0016427107 /DNA_START=14 /DNA_END=895 /DNA_ORIENTATION=+